MPGLVGCSTAGRISYGRFH